MLVGSFNVNNNPSKKFLIATALIGYLTNKYKCKPPDLDLTGTTGSLCSAIISKYFLYGKLE